MYLDSLSQFERCFQSCPVNASSLFVNQSSVCIQFDHAFTANLYMHMAERLLGEAVERGSPSLPRAGYKVIRCLDHLLLRLGQ
jgi:hypothetical protein